MPKHLPKERKHFGCHPGSRLDSTKHTLFRETYQPPPPPLPIPIPSESTTGIEGWRVQYKISVLYRATISVVCVIQTDSLNSSRTGRMHV